MRNPDPSTLRACARWLRARVRENFMGNLHESSKADGWEEAARYFEAQARGALRRATRKPAKRKGDR